MKVVLITGGLMEERVKEIADKFGYEVFTAPVDIASFISTDHLTRLRGYDLMLVPGYSRADLSEVERVTGIKTYRGPKDVANLEVVLENIEDIKFSKKTPACEILTNELRIRALSEIERVEAHSYKKRLLKEEWNMLIGDVAVGRDFPMRVLAEIVDADTLSNEAVFSRAEYYVSEGADMIDLGISNRAPERIRELLKLLRKLKVPLSVDTMDYENIMAAIDSKADLILSLDRGLIEKLPPTDIPVVVVPGRKKFRSINERITCLKENIELAESSGFKNVVADPILEPINYGLSQSISSYAEFSEKERTPTLMGVGNVTELLDADSIGVNAALAGIAMECGVGILLTTEASDKTAGCVGELKRASHMMYLTRNRKTPPKDLGLDLLVFKEKTRRSSPIEIQGKRVAAKSRGHGRDSAGNFTMIVSDRIEAIHSKDGKTDIIIVGDNAGDICDTILHLGLVSDLDHSLYLGRELEKAEIALRTGRSYVQDEAFFEEPY